ncbi:nitrogen fixation protein [Iningainema tapete]|uniref:Nitrogen fixation protein n=1 Tax=Iningainema tapete BLCC-T55 TaxID=2748662 RepID=A0A8J6XNA4_9CYAN|nr:nitrogen fixation protein [Iningainema tapete]MBD2774171.1 nitrogen fixation protein [Iningainema tapete BLCC-T55]
MENTTTQTTTPFCPSARSESENSTVFGIIAGTVDEPRVNYLDKTVPVTDELISLCTSVTPTEVFRMASPCVGNGCLHFDGTHCRLATRITQQLPTVVEELPPCRIRQNCRWWQQEGKAACMRCPQIMTDNYNPSELMRQVTTPTVDH